MESTYANPQEILNIYQGEQTDYDLIVYGTKDLTEQLNDTLSAALSRYMDDKGIGTNKLSRLTGIAKGTISRYCHGTARYNPDYLYAICIALRLQPCRQRHLFVLLEKTMPDERGKNNKRAFIIREYLDGCFYDDCYTVIACNKRLEAIGEAPLTALSSETEGK